MHQVLRLALPVAAVTVGFAWGPLGWAAAGVAVLAEWAWAVRYPSPHGWWAPALATGAGLVAARLVGPLAPWTGAGIVVFTLGSAVLIEAAGFLADRAETTSERVPLQLVGAGMVGLGLFDATLAGHLPTWGPALAGAWFLARHVLRSQVVDLFIGVALVDLGALLLGVRQGWADPLAYVAPLSLSVLLVAQRLRGQLTPHAVGLTRYAAAGALYLTGFGQMVADPRDTALILLIAIAGVVAGQVLRVLSFLQLGLGVLAGVLVWNLLRFGLAHSEFWAWLLTGLGVIVLATMVVITTYREPLARLQERMRARLANWEA